MREQTSQAAVMEMHDNHADNSNHSDHAHDEILTSREARMLVKIGRTKLWELTRGGKIPAYRVGDGKTSDLRYKKSELLRWLDANLVNGVTAR